MSSENNNVYDKLPTNWKEVWDACADSQLCRLAISQAYEDDMLDQMDPEHFLTGEFKQTFVDLYGMDESQLEKFVSNQKVNFSNFISDLFDTINTKESDHEINLTRKDKYLVEVDIVNKFNNKKMVIEIAHQEDNFIEDIFIPKNDLFIGETYKSFFNKLTSEPYIKFEV